VSHHSYINEGGKTVSIKLSDVVRVEQIIGKDYSAEIFQTFSSCAASTCVNESDRMKCQLPVQVFYDLNILIAAM